ACLILLQYFKEIMAGIDAGESRHALEHVSQEFRWKVVNGDPPVQTDEPHVEFSQHREIGELVHRRENLNIQKTLGNDGPLEPPGFTSLADQQEINLRMIHKTPGKTKNVFKVLRDSKVSTVEEYDLVSQPKVCTVMRWREVRSVQGRPIVKHLQLILFVVGETALEVLQIARRLNANNIGNLILLDFLPSKEPPDQPASEDSRIHCPLGKNVAQNHVRRAAPQGFEPPYERAKKDGR